MVDDFRRLLLAHLKGRNHFPIVVSGDVGAGKTSTCMEALEGLEDEDFRSGGILSPRVIESGRTVGYDAVDPLSGERRSFLRTDPPGEERVGRFYLRPGGLKFAREAISRGIDRTDLVFFDEVGRMELDGRGLATSLGDLLASDVQGVYLVRSDFLGRFREDFQLEEYDLLRV